MWVIPNKLGFSTFKSGGGVIRFPDNTGLLINTDCQNSSWGINRLYYSSNIDLACYVFDSLLNSSYGSLSFSQPEASLLFEEMNQMGFFTKSFLPFPGLNFHINPDSNLALKVQQAYDITIKERYFPNFITEAESIAQILEINEAVNEACQYYLIHTSEPEVKTLSINKKTRPSFYRGLTFYSSLNGSVSQSDYESIVEKLDSRDLHIIWKNNLSGERLELWERKNELFNRLENEGFQFEIELNINAKSFLNARSFMFYTMNIEKMLNDSPTRKIRIRLSDPSKLLLNKESYREFSSKWRTFLLKLYQVNADISRLNVYELYFDALFNSKVSQKPYDVSLKNIIPQLISPGIFPTLTEKQKSVSSQSDLSVSSLYDYKTDNPNSIAGQLNCSGCAQEFVCPKFSFIPAYQRDSISINEAQTVCSQHKELVPLILNEILRNCSENLPDAPALQMNFNKDEALYQPLN